MRTIKLTSEMTKNEFRKEFTNNFEFIYIRVKASKGGKTKLGHSKFFVEGSEVSVDGNFTVAEFEKDATAKTGMEVSVYYETKAEGKRSKYYQANKKDANTTLNDLDKRVSEKDDIVSPKEYMANLVITKNHDENFKYPRWNVRKLDYSGKYYMGRVEKDILEEMGFVFDSKGEIDLDKSNVDSDEILNRDYDFCNHIEVRGSSLKNEDTNNYNYVIENLFPESYNDTNLNYDPKLINIIEIDEDDVPKNELERGYYIQYTQLGQYYNGGEITINPVDFDSRKLTLTISEIDMGFDIERYMPYGKILTSIKYDGRDIDFFEEFESDDDLQTDVILIKVSKDEDDDVSCEEIWRTSKLFKYVW